MKKTTATKTRITSKREIDLPRFRYLDDVVRYVSDVSKDVDELNKVAKKQVQLLAYLREPGAKVTAFMTKAAGLTFDIDTGSGPKTRGLKRKLDPTDVDIIVPNVKKLEKQYALAEEFYEKHRELEAVEATLITQFRNRSDGPAFNEALNSIRRLKAKVAEGLKAVLGELNSIAEGHVPASFKKYMHALENAVKERVNFEDSNLFLYIHVDNEGNLVFTYYMMLNHAVNDEGKITPHLYISVQWIVGESNVSVAVNHEYELPNKLMAAPGQSVTSVGQAVQAIGHLLDLEDFSTALGTLPLGPSMKKDPHADLFSYKDFISKIKVEGDTMTFELRKTADKSKIREIAYQLYTEVKSMLRVPKGAKLKMEIRPNAIMFNLASVAAPGQVNTYQAEWIKDQFGLNDTQLRKIVNIINQAKD